MPNNLDSRAVSVSVKVYERMLGFYPAGFRREFGPAMKQLFRDQCRDTWSEGRGRGLALLWIRVLPDLAKTSVKEHLLSGGEAEPRAAFIKWFAIVFVCTVIFSIGQALWTPKVYSSTVRIQVEKDAPDGPAHSFGSDPYFLATQFKIIESYSILTNVIEKLHLQSTLARPNERPLTLDQAYAALFKQIFVEQTGSSSLIEISVKNSDPKLTADIANAIVEAYRKARQDWWKEGRSAGLYALQEQLRQGQSNVSMMESNLDQLRSKLGIPDVSEQSAGAGAFIEAAQLQEYQREEMKAEADYLEYSNVLAVIAALPTGDVGKMLSTVHPTTDPELAQLSNRLAGAREKFIAIQSTFGENHPDRLSARKQLEQAQLDYDKKVAAIISGMKERMTIDQKALQTAQQMRSDLEARSSEMARKSQPYFRLKRDIEDLRHDNQDLKRMIERETAEAGAPGDLVIVRDPAKPIMRPVNTVPGMIFGRMVGGTLAALAGGGAAAWIAYFVRRTHHRPNAPA